MLKLLGLLFVIMPPAPGYAVTSCNESSDCQSQDEICDLQLPSGKMAGTCLKPCVPGSQCSQAGYICNPLSKLCEPSCQVLNGVDPCQSRTAAAVSSPSKGVCFVPPGQASGYCSVICTSGGGQCPSSFTCPNGFCMPPIESGCGDGVVAVGETCDEGVLGQKCGVCPKNWTCDQATNQCVPLDKYPNLGNGQPGHCNMFCQDTCSVYVDYAAKSNGDGSKSKPVQTINQAGVGALSLLAAKVPTPVPTCPPQAIQGNAWIRNPGQTSGQYDCPCGYGIWVNKGNSSSLESFPINLTQSLPIYGGFMGTEKSIYDRVDVLNKPLGQFAFSQTVLSSAGDSVISIGDKSTSITVIFDGFRIKGGNSSVDKNVCNLSEQGAGGVTICKNATATLNNLHIKGNSTTASGGGIRNLGALILSNSYVALNTAQTSGGGLSNEGTNATISYTTFYGNGFNNATLAPLCTAGYNASPAAGDVGPAGSQICPTGMTCPDGGGFCKPSSGSVPGNSTTSGGGIASISGLLTISNSRIQANYAYGNGGGIYLNASAHSITNTLFAENWASWAGGGLYLDSAGTLKSLDKSTFIDNKAYNQGGGGIWLGTNGANNKISRSQFVNNKGLYARNNNNMAQWGGNVPNDNQINSISWSGAWASNGQLGNQLNPSTIILNGNTACPVSAYTLSTGVCDGSDICGNVSIPSVTGIEYSATCSSNCPAPLYEGSICAVPCKQNSDCLGGTPKCNVSNGLCGL